MCVYFRATGFLMPNKFSYVCIFLLIVYVLIVKGPMVPYRGIIA